MKKKRMSERWYYFFVSLVLSLSIFSVLLSLFVAYTNTQAQGFGETHRPFDIYRRVDGNYVVVFGDNSMLIDVNSLLHPVGMKKNAEETVRV